MDWNDEYLNSLLAVMEANLTYVPSSTSKGELSDISLFDHVKLTAAIASCMYDYLNENHLKYKEELLVKRIFMIKKLFYYVQWIFQVFRNLFIRSRPKMH